MKITIDYTVPLKLSPAHQDFIFKTGHCYSHHCIDKVMDKMTSLLHLVVCILYPVCKTEQALSLRAENLTLPVAPRDEMGEESICWHVNGMIK